MTQVVINRCYGGFSLSDEAEDLYAQKSGFAVFRYVQTKRKFRDGVDLFERVSGGGAGPDFNLKFTFKTDLGKSFSDFPNGHDDYWSSRELDRDDPVLTQVVRELGERANGQFASLQIIEVPDDVKWQIEEYDGNEWVAEAHRTW